jgi:hypothetical protein
VDFPALVELPDASLVQRLRTDGFVARTKEGPIQIKSVETDTGPRRILFVVESGKNVPAATRKLEAAILTEILSNANAQDSFALLPTQKSIKEVRFGASRETLGAVVKDLEDTLPVRGEEERVLDSLQEATGWFQQQQGGDSIIVLTTGLEGNPRVLGLEGYRRSTYAEVKEALIKAHVRVFGVQFGQISGGNVNSDSIVGSGFRAPLIVEQGPEGPMILGGGPFGVHKAPPYLYDLGDLHTLSRSTAGFAGLLNLQGQSWKPYKVTDHRLKAVTYLGMQEYKAIEEYYRIRISHPPRHFSLDLADPIRKQLPHATVIYPEDVPACSPAATPPPH